MSTKYYYILYVDVVASSTSELQLRQQITKLNEFNSILANILYPRTVYDDTQKWDIAYQASTGDGAVFCVYEPKDQFLLSIMLHRSIFLYNENISDDLEKIQIRIGISSGETMLVTHFDRKTNAPWGRDIVMAKRIMDIATANQILVSEHVVQQVKQLDRNYEFIDMGRHTVKHGEKMTVYSFLYQDGKNQIGNANPIS